MDGHLTPPTFALLVGTLVGMTLAWLMAGRRRSTPGALPLGLLALAAAVWSGTRLLEALAPTADAKILWSKFQYVGITTVPLCWVWFAAHYGRQTHWLTRRAAGLAVGLSAGTLLLAWTNDWHGLIWAHITWAAGGQDLIYDHGPAFWLFTAYTYAMLLLGAVWIVNAVRRTPDWYHGPALLVLIAVAVPWLGNVIYLTAGDQLEGVDPTPLALVVGCILIAVSVFRLQLLELLPVARTLVIERMRDGVVVLDEAQRLVDLNPAARQMLGRAGRDGLGKSATLVVPNWAALQSRLAQDDEARADLQVEGVWLEARLSRLPGPASAPAGWLLVLRDITERREAEAARQLSEARLRQVIDLVPHFIFAKDAAGQYLFANQALAEAYGTRPEELRGRRDTDYPNVAAEAARFQQEDQVILASGEPLLIPMETLTDAQGRARVFQTVKIPLTFSGESTPAVLGVSTDITELKRAEAALRTSELQWRAILEHFPIAMLVARPDGTLEYFNHKHEALFGYRREAILTEAAWWQSVVPEAAERTAVLQAVTAMMAEAASTGEESRPRLLTLLSQAGEQRQVECHCVNAPDHRLWAFADVTPLKQTEAALRQSERHHRLLAENASDVIWTMDFGGRYTYVSPAVEQLRGYTEQEVLAQTLEETVTPASLPIMMDCIQTAVQELLLHQRQPVPVREVEQPCKDGRTVWTEVLARVMYNDEGQPAGIMGVSRDITARKRLEAENQRLLEASRRRAMEAETLREAGAAVAGTLDLDEIFSRILDQLRRVVPYDSASVQLLRDGGMEVVGGRGFADVAAVVGLRFPLDATTPVHEVVTTRRPVILADAPQYYDSFRQPPHDHIVSWLGVPLLAQDRLIGMLTLDSVQPAAFTEDHKRLATAFADQVSIALEQARLFQEIQRLAITDALTGVHNRRHFFELAELEYALARRYGHALSILMLDIDHFKAVNDTYGHAAGDRVLQRVAQLCRDLLRRADLVGRYGGEEFVCLLPETALAGAAQVAGRLRVLIRETLIPVSAATEARVTVSIGVSTLHLEADASAQPRAALELLVEQADRALYQAKGGGRDQVVTFEALPAMPAD